MSRLTKVYGNGNITLDASLFPPIDQNTLDGEIKNSEPFKAAVAKLADYEDAEENGLLVRLPCKVGDTVYVKMQFGRYAEAEVRDYTHFISCGFCVVVTSDKFNKQNIPFSEFGKTVFLTREEAMQALKARDSK